MPWQDHCRQLDGLAPAVLLRETEVPDLKGLLRFDLLGPTG